MKHWWMWMAMLAGVSAATASEPSKNPQDFFDLTTTSAIPIDVNAQTIEYDHANGMIHANGNVVIRRDRDTMQADRMDINVTNHDVIARGNVVLTRDSGVWRGNELVYNLASRTWHTGVFTAYLAPYHVRAEEAAKTNDTTYILKHAILSSCKTEYPGCHYHLTAREVRLTPGESMVARGVVTWFGPVPVFYVPWWRRSLGPHTVGIGGELGFDSRWGAYIGTRITVPITDNLKADTLVDYRGKRGPGIGEDLKWKSGDDAQGMLGVYYAHDTDGQNDHAGDPQADLVETERYRVKLAHSQSLGLRDSFMGSLNYLSDPYVLQDFFNDEYRDAYEPENFLALIHRGDHYSAGASVYTRLNDFFTSVNRVPEVTLDASRQQLGQSPFYYESRNAAAYLTKAWAEPTIEDDYSVTRVDSSHALFYPGKYVGFLNVTPRVGYDLTYYSATRQDESVTELVQTTTTNTVIGPGGVPISTLFTETHTNTVTHTLSQGSDVRSLFELGAETSFKAFRSWDDADTGFGKGLRHIVEPYANYTYIPEPNLTPDRLYQFDNLDTLDEEHSIRLGVVNRLQTKRRAQVRGLLDLDTWTTYRINVDTNRVFTDVGFRGQIYPATWLRCDVDGLYNFYDSRLDEFNIRATYKATAWEDYIEYRFRENDSSLLSVDMAFSPNRSWTFEGFARYEFESSRIEEEGMFVRRNLDCMVVGLGGTHLPSYTRSDGSSCDDEYKVSVQLALTAFPSVRIGSGHRHY